MDIIFPHRVFPYPGRGVPLSFPALPSVTPTTVTAVPPAQPEDRIAQVTALPPEDAAAGLLWLAMSFPAVTDAMLGKLDCDAIDEED